MTRECHVRFCERLGVRLPGATLPSRTDKIQDYNRKADIRGAILRTKEAPKAYGRSLTVNEKGFLLESATPCADRFIDGKWG